jgi:hypothetical protein
MSALDWQDDSACRDADPRLFDGETSVERVAAAALCADCPVRAKCLDSALAQPTIEVVQAGWWWNARGKHRPISSCHSPMPEPLVVVAAGAQCGDHTASRSRYMRGCHGPGCVAADREYKRQWQSHSRRAQSQAA